ncbi:MAG: flagellar biosynthetic protein FliO [Sedimenticolaceae bacterium]
MNTRLSSLAALIALAGVTHATPSEPPSRLIDSPLSAGNLVDTGVGLMIVLAIMLGLAWLVKRYVQVPGIGKGQVQIHGGVSLGAREKAVLLSVEGRRLLVGVAPGRVQTLLVLDDTANPRPAFAEQLEVASGAAAAGRPVERE